MQAQQDQGFNVRARIRKEVKIKAKKTKIIHIGKTKSQKPIQLQSQHRGGYAHPSQRPGGFSCLVAKSS